MDVTQSKPKWSRRKDARPAEIIEAALDVFAECGFAAAKLGDVAQRAGVVKGTLYRYFDTKEDLFRAVVQHAVAINLQGIEQASAGDQGTLRERVPLMLDAAAGRLGDRRVPALARLVIGESRTFPDLATIWHDNVVAHLLKLLTGVIGEAQQRGEVRPGDPTLYAFSVLGPLIAGALFKEVFGSFSPYAPDLQGLARQHAETVTRGMT
ncbi:TetR/AcrR family transcriptional regulator [Pseudomonas citrulli]|uniref:TetR/AcrR family transcriptional regulator n=1 Tax=Pseudomonas citrulli TaxID=3064347 RepID=A0ABT9C165_9PSED|nr:TetR/AcrR family transcriptional regulator [Pseudomonas sp. K18]MDO7896937.1 TetR/AcrR family transcriptional regulator [Pseudomonas sp. K18]